MDEQDLSIVMISEDIVSASECNVKTLHAHDKTCYLL